MKQIKNNHTVGIWQQRIGYGMADFASNLIWQMITLYLMFFYTDIAGLKPVEIGMLFLVIRILAGVGDVAMGIIIDKTNTRWGKARPWYLWGAIPFGLFSILAFYIPNIGPGGKLIYAYITYLGLSLAYAVVNIPQTAILPLLTGDSHERTMLSTSRIFFSFMGATIVSGFTLHLVDALGKGSKANGFLFTMMIFSIIGVLMLLYTFRNVREKVTIKKEDLTVKQTLSSLKDNYPWYIFALNIIFMWGAYFFQQGALIYYFTYYLRLPHLAIVIATISTLVPLAGAISTPFFSKKVYKRALFQISSGIHLAGIIVILLANQNVAIIIIGAVISALGFGVRHSIYFSMQADPVDYAEWKTGIRASGIISAINGFVGKLAMAGEGVFSSFLLSKGHYMPGKLQEDSALFAIKLNYLIIPSVLIIISMITMSFYNLDKIYPKIREEIDAGLQANGKNGSSGLSITKP